MPFLNFGPAYFIAKGVSGRAGSSSVLGEAGSVLVHCPQFFNLSGVTSIRPVSSAVILIAYDNVDSNYG